VQEHLLARGHEAARDQRRFRRPALGIDEVRHDLDLLLRLEDLDRDFLEVLGDGRDDIGLLDAETRDRKVRAVLPDDRHVRPVQGGHETEAPRGEHLAREMGRDRVRKRVVDVNEVETFVRRHVAHTRREREVVGRVLEERIRRDRHLVIRDAVEEDVQARRHRVRDEVHVVPAPRELVPELRRDDARAAERRVAGDADLHVLFPPS
jgi:hypothetical protein